MILEKARELGLALSESEEFMRMQSARAAMEANEMITSMLEEYQEKQDRIVNMLSGDDLDRTAVAALSSDVEALQEQLLANPLFSEALEAQNAFQNLMGMVNKEIGSCIGVNGEGETSGGCSGSCGSCGGCHH